VGFFIYNNTTKSIFNTPLLASVTHDMLTWRLEMDGVYTVKSAYKDIMNHDVEDVQHRLPGEL